MNSAGRIVQPGNRPAWPFPGQALIGHLISNKNVATSAGSLHGISVIGVIQLITMVLL